MLQSIAIGLSTLNHNGTAAQSDSAGQTNPGTSWERFSSPEAAGFRSASLNTLEQTLFTKPTTSLLVVKGGKIVYSYGDISHVSYLASARKSILSILYGKCVGNGTIDLNKTVGELGINESGEGLLPLEKTATIRHLLMSSSGVYWPESNPSGNSLPPPARGSHKPGEYFYYNNWDYNVAGAVFEQLTGKTIFRALADDLATPLQFQDFDLARQRMLGYPEAPSRYKSYQMWLSTRDMARLGLLMVNGGVWSGRRLVSSSWVKESTALHVKAAALSNMSGVMGYAYMWWKPTVGRPRPEWVDSYLAVGNHGQFILGLPALDTVVVHKRALPDEFAIAINTGRTKAQPIGGPFTYVDFLALADIIVAARA
jgi:CubicO group peptidase (beta-lactamase class C family)